MSAVVLDASAGVEIAARTLVGRRLRAAIPAGSTTWVPEHYFVEAASVIRRSELYQRLTPARAQRALDRLVAMPASRASIRALLPDAWALRANLTVADALYVVLAEHVGGLLVTTDLRLANAPGLTVGTITP